jgi:hypothetical protein
MLSALLPRKQANQTKPGGGRKLLQGDQALRYKSPIQNQETAKVRKIVTPIRISLFSSSLVMGKSSDRSLPIPHRCPG